MWKDYKIVRTIAPGPERFAQRLKKPNHAVMDKETEENLRALGYLQ
jgi:hypothetical protein